MLLDLTLLIAGLAILVAGGEALVKGATQLARNLGVSPLIIGLTIVAFGTSAPELAVNVGAALSDTGALSFGNIFGSNMANIGLIIGLVAIINPIPIRSILIRRELPMMLLATTAAIILAIDDQLGGARSIYMRGDGLILLLFFFVFLYYTIGDLLRNRNGAGSELDESGSGLIEIPDENEPANPSLARNLGLSVLGLVGLIGGAHLTVIGAVDVARLFEIPEVIIGLTLVAVGTSLPELVAAISAMRHGRTDMAVGSVVGSNIFNTLLVAGTTATIRPMEIPPHGQLDLWATAILSLAFTLTASTHRNIIIRYEGLGLLIMYLSYLTWRSMHLAAGAGV
jgi:cation:H+ antiporter